MSADLCLLYVTEPSAPVTPHLVFLPLPLSQHVTDEAHKLDCHRQLIDIDLHRICEMIKDHVCACNRCELRGPLFSTVLPSCCW